MKKQQLAILLSKLHTLPNPQPRLEQYPTPSGIAADALCIAHLWNDIQEKNIADLGCGNGILGCAALLLGAKHAHFVDIDEKALAVSSQNVDLLQKVMNTTYPATYHATDITSFHQPADCILQNPPFGVQQEHADRAFLLQAVKAPTAYSFHKLDTQDFVTRFVRQHGKTATLLKTYPFPLWKSMKHHTKRVKHTDVGFWRIA